MPAPGGGPSGSGGDEGGGGGGGTCDALWPCHPAVLLACFHKPFIEPIAFSRHLDCDQASMTQKGCKEALKTNFGNNTYTKHSY